jgi:hypothetical protein
MSARCSFETESCERWRQCSSRRIARIRFNSTTASWKFDGVLIMYLRVCRSSFPFDFRTSGLLQVLPVRFACHRDSRVSSLSRPHFFRRSSYHPPSGPRGFSILSGNDSVIDHGHQGDSEVRPLSRSPFEGQGPHGSEQSFCFEADELADRLLGSRANASAPRFSRSRLRSDSRQHRGGRDSDGLVQQPHGRFGIQRG